MLQYEQLNIGHNVMQIITMDNLQRPRIPNLFSILAKWLAMRNIYAATQTTPSGWFVSSIAADGEAALSDEVFFATIPCGSTSTLSAGAAPSAAQPPGRGGSVDQGIS